MIVENTIHKSIQKGLKRAKKQNKNIIHLKTIIDLLVEDKPLDAKNNEHKLTGVWNKHHDCHIEPDWILIYRKTKGTLILERMGSHSELFK